MPDYADVETQVAALETIRQPLADAIITEMRRNPFWADRYGERGEAQARKDVQHNINYLIAALRMDSPESLADYYRWLRGALVYRGISTQHLRETLDWTERFMRELLPAPAWQRIEKTQLAGCGGLDYIKASAQAVQEVAVGLATRATQRLIDNQMLNPLHRQVCHRDLIYHLSYLADSLEFDAPEMFYRYVVWLGDFLEKHGVSRTGVRNGLEALQLEGRLVLPADVLARFDLMEQG